MACELVRWWNQRESNPSGGFPRAPRANLLVPVRGIGLDPLAVGLGPIPPPSSSSPALAELAMKDLANRLPSPSEECAHVGGRVVRCLHHGLRASFAIAGHLGAAALEVYAKNAVDRLGGVAP